MPAQYLDTGGELAIASGDDRATSLLRVFAHDAMHLAVYGRAPADVGGDIRNIGNGDRAT